MSRLQDGAVSPHHPRDEVQYLPIFENYLKMSRFNMSEEQVLARCFIPVKSNENETSRDFNHSDSDQLDCDDEDLIKALEGDSDFSETVSDFSSISISINQPKRKKKRSERWRNNSRKSSLAAAVAAHLDQRHSPDAELGANAVNERLSDPEPGSARSVGKVNSSRSKSPSASRPHSRSSTDMVSESKQHGEIVRSSHTEADAEEVGEKRRSWSDKIERGDSDSSIANSKRRSGRSRASSAMSDDSHRRHKRDKHKHRRRHSSQESTESSRRHRRGSHRSADDDERSTRSNKSSDDRRRSLKGHMSEELVDEEEEKRLGRNMRAAPRQHSRRLEP